MHAMETILIGNLIANLNHIQKELKINSGNFLNI